MAEQIVDEIKTSTDDSSDENEEEFVYPEFVCKIFAKMTSLLLAQAFEVKGIPQLCFYVVCSCQKQLYCMYIYMMYRVTTDKKWHLYVGEFKSDLPDSVKEAIKDKWDNYTTGCDNITAFKKVVNQYYGEMIDDMETKKDEYYMNWLNKYYLNNEWKEWLESESEMELLNGNIVTEYQELKWNDMDWDIVFMNSINCNNYNWVKYSISNGANMNGCYVFFDDEMIDIEYLYDDEIDGK